MNNQIYLALLLDRKTRNPIERMEAVMQETEERAYQITLAYAYHREGNSPEALEIMEKMRLNFNKDSPSSFVIYATVLAANGKNSEAVSYAKSIKKDKLIGPEKELLSEVIDPFVDTKL